MGVDIVVASSVLAAITDMFLSALYERPVERNTLVYRASCMTLLPLDDGYNQSMRSHGGKVGDLGITTGPAS